MSVSENLFLAILSMDAYNRGYGVGMEVSGSQIGNATLRDDIVLPVGSVQASFLAQAYTWNDQTVISYRGTDQILPDPSQWLLNVLQGWVGAGSPAGAQASMPLEVTVR